MLVLLLRKEEWVELNIETYFLISTSHILNIAHFLLSMSCFWVNWILKECTSFCSVFSWLSYRLFFVFSPSLKLPACTVIFTNHINWKDCILLFYIIISPKEHFTLHCIFGYLIWHFYLCFCFLHLPPSSLDRGSLRTQSFYRTLWGLHP